MTFLQRLGFTFIRAKIKFLSLFSINWAAQYVLKLFCTPFQKSKLRDNDLFKSAAQEQFQFGEYTIKGYRFNHPQQQKVLILHGFSSSALNFEKYILPLINKGYEVLAFDAPAHGKSSGNSIHAIIYKEMIQHILTRYYPIKNFISHSFGGLALALAMEEIKPEGNTNMVFIAPAAETTTAIDNAFKMLDINDEHLKNKFNQLIYKISNKSPEWFSVNRALQQINGNILFVQDEHDAITPLKDLAPTLNANLPNVSTLITTELGHNKIYRNAKVVNHIVDYIAQQN